MAIKTVQTVATSPVIAALFAACDAMNEATDRHEREVLKSSTFETNSTDERKANVTENNALNDAWVTAMYAVCQHPVATAADLRAKLAFMVEFEMGDGINSVADRLGGRAADRRRQQRRLGRSPCGPSVRGGTDAPDEQSVPRD